MNVKTVIRCLAEALRPDTGLALESGVHLPMEHVPLEKPLAGRALLCPDSARILSHSANPGLHMVEVRAFSDDN